MRWFIPVILAIVLFSYCGKSEEGVNRPPRIDQITVTPKILYAADVINLTPSVADPDGDKVKLTYHWFKNGRMLPDAKDQDLDTEMNKGDRIEVEVIPNDGKIDGKPYKVGPLTVVNSPPEIKGYTLEPLDLKSDAELDLTIEADDIDGDRVSIEVNWEIDGNNIDELRDHYKLTPGNFKRDQTIVGIITASDGEDSHEIRSTEVKVGNSAPKIVGHQTRYADGRCFITVQSKDYDDDPISISASGPDGLVVDEEKSTVSWDVSGSSGEVYDATVTVELSDPQGGITSTEIPISLEF